MYKVLFTFAIATLLSLSVHAQDSLAVEKEPKFKESLLLNKWWVSNPNYNDGRNGLKQYYRELGKFKTIGVNTGSWGWRDKQNGVMYVDYVGQKWEQKIIKLTENEFVYERGGKTFYLKSN
ncbi:MAG: hypothetical protein WBA74_21050 [Cyclobacteriaceae bacterium]